MSGGRGAPPDPPSSGTSQPISVRSDLGGARSGSAHDWPDDETFAGGPPRTFGHTGPTMTARALLDERALTVGLTLLAGNAGAGRHG